MKLGSGIAPIPEMLANNIHVSIAADGAPCNNNLDMFQEMRMAALMQKPLHGPTAMPAAKVFEMATLGGARAMGMEDLLGSVEVGKKADLALVALNGLHNAPAKDGDIYGQLVYQLKSSDVAVTMVDGKLVWDSGSLLTINEGEVRRQCSLAIARLRQRTGI
jgi:cytosine/adenosine deaminase-related metal-dependent hydrolase